MYFDPAAQTALITANLHPRMRLNLIIVSDQSDRYRCILVDHLGSFLVIHLGSRRFQRFIECSVIDFHLLSHGSQYLTFLFYFYDFKIN